jgi:hypothetical protein
MAFLPEPARHRQNEDQPCHALAFLDGHCKYVASPDTARLIWRPKKLRPNKAPLNPPSAIRAELVAGIFSIPPHNSPTTQ